MAKETWATDEVNRLAGFLDGLQNSLQTLELEWDIKVDDAMLVIETMARPNLRLGVVTMLSKSDTLIQFEAGDYEIGPV